MNNLKNKSNKKISQLKLEVVRFDSLDVIATSLPDYLPLNLLADKDEVIGNPTFTSVYYGGSNYAPYEYNPGYYYEPTSGQ
ncbi:MAG: hypothetical protein IK086_03690 [Clostridia bacterium]|nr:hypothetical protein [Clostridia bacterium]